MNILYDIEGWSKGEGWGVKGREKKIGKGRWRRRKEEEEGGEEKGGEAGGG